MDIIEKLQTSDVSYAGIWALVYTLEAVDSYIDRTAPDRVRPMDHLLYIEVHGVATTCRDTHIEINNNRFECVFDDDDDMIANNYLIENCIEMRCRVEESTPYNKYNLASHDVAYDKIIKLMEL